MPPKRQLHAYLTNTGLTVARTQPRSLPVRTTVSLTTTRLHAAAAAAATPEAGRGENEEFDSAALPSSSNAYSNYKGAKLLPYEEPEEAVVMLSNSGSRFSTSIGSRRPRAAMEGSQVGEEEEDDDDDDDDYPLVFSDDDDGEVPDSAALRRERRTAAWRLLLQSPDCDTSQLPRGSITKSTTVAVIPFARRKGCEVAKLRNAPLWSSSALLADQRKRLSARSRLLTPLITSPSGTGHSQRIYGTAPGTMRAVVFQHSGPRLASAQNFYDVFLTESNRRVPTDDDDAALTELLEYLNINSAADEGRLTVPLLRYFSQQKDDDCSSAAESSQGCSED